MAALREALGHPDKRLFLQRKYRIEQMEDLHAPKAVMDEAVTLLREVEGKLDVDSLADLHLIYNAYSNMRKSDAA